MHSRTLSYLRFRRILLDIPLSALLLLFLLPLLILIYLLILLLDGSPVLYLSSRVGQHSSVFHLYKFRTLLADGTTPTKTGIFLRRTSLDELPQLINILIGQMSLIGPRPLPASLLTTYYTALQIQLRQSVPSGITGLSQVSTRGLPRDPAEKLDLDIKYINHLGFVLDLSIIIRTATALVYRFRFNSKGHTL